MSVFDDAKLIITPNGYKAGKLYSLKPFDGSGDCTVVRNTTATRVKSGGLIESSAVNIPRLDYSGGVTCPAILVEPQSTNQYLNNTLTSGYVTETRAIKGATISNAFGTGFDGFAYDFIGGVTFVNSEYRVSTFINTTTRPIQRWCVYIKSPSSDFISIFILGATSVRFQFSTLQSNSALGEIIKINSDTYACFVFTDVALGSAFGSLRIGFVTSLATDNPTINGSAIIGQLFYQGLEVGTLPNTYSAIPTGASTVTRNADVITATVPAGVTEITEYFEDETTNVITTIPVTYTMSVGRISKVIMI